MKEDDVKYRNLPLEATKKRINLLKNDTSS